MHFTSAHNESHKSTAHTVTGNVLLITMFLVSITESNYNCIIFLEDSLVLTILWKLLTDTCLLSAFMLQHSVMASNIIKNIYQKLHRPDLERSIYNACSAAALHAMITNWQPVPWVSLWNIDTTSNIKSWIFFSTCHFLGWLIIYSGCVVLDIAELAGLKQVYYKISGRPCPMTTKSKEYQRYLAHMRHPSFTGFLIILWIHPYMT